MRLRASIRVKLQLLIGMAVAVVLAALVLIVNLRLSGLLGKLLAEAAADTASRFTAVTENAVERPLVVATTLAQLTGSALEAPPAERRARLDELLALALEKNDRFSAVWTAWSPDALDGLFRVPKVLG